MDARATGRALSGSDLHLATIEPNDAKAEADLWLALDESDLPLFRDGTRVDCGLEPAVRQAILRAETHLRVETRTIGGA